MKKYIHYKGKKIYYSDEGNGYPVLLVHGYLETGDVWKDFASSLSERFRVLVIDLPGHGHSDIYGESHTMEFLAEAICGLMDTLGIEKIFLAGHSLGGYVALAFVEKFAARLAGYCLFHSHPFADSEDAIRKREREIIIVKSGKKFLMYPDNVKRMFADPNAERLKAEIERLKKIASGISGEGIMAVLRGMMARPSRLAIMEEGKVPCLWILGSMDNYILCDNMKQRVRLPSNAELVILEDSGHLGFIEEKEKSASILTDFILKNTIKDK
jgi:pimeloyl-ACP methyl ester carboxylesterase